MTKVKLNTLKLGATFKLNHKSYEFYKQGVHKGKLGYFCKELDYYKQETGAIKILFSDQEVEIESLND